VIYNLNQPRLEKAMMKKDVKSKLVARNDCVTRLTAKINSGKFCASGTWRRHHKFT